MGFFDNDLESKEKTLERVKLDKEIAQERRAEAEAKAIEADMKNREGSTAKKIWGFVKKLKPDEEKVSDLYSAGFGDLRDLNDPRSGFKRRSR